MQLINDIHKAALTLSKGGLVAFATETVYGLGADARNDRAVAEIFAAKGRPGFNPLIIHVATHEAAFRLGDFGATAQALANAFWPGPLSIVVPLRADAGISKLATAGLGTVALRIPAREQARQLLAEFGGPVAAPSANPSGHISATTPAHVLAGLGAVDGLVLDGGRCDVGVESTIIDATGNNPAILRPGGVTSEQIEAITGASVKLANPVTADAPTAPGQLTSHYAPRAAVRLNAASARPGEILLAFGPGDTTGALNLSPSGDTTEAAANLFAMLHQLDADGATTIAVNPIPATGLGVAINDRLARAAAPRPQKRQAS